MPFSTFHISGALPDLTGVPHPVGGTTPQVRLWLECSDPLLSAGGREGRTGGILEVAIDEDGECYIDGIPATVNGAPMYRLRADTIDYKHGGRAGYGEAFTSWFAVTGNTTIGELIAVHTEPVMVSPALYDTLASYVAAAQAARDAAIAAKVAAEAARDAAIDISGITTTDAAVKAALDLPASQSRRYIETYLPVARYGALGTAADDTAAIQAAIDAAHAAGGGTVLLARGALHKVSGLQLRSGVVLEGHMFGRRFDGSNADIQVGLKQLAGSTVPVIGLASVNHGGVGVGVQNLRIHGNKAAQTTANRGIDLHRIGTTIGGVLARDRIENVVIEHTSGTGLYVGHAVRDSLVSGVSTYHCDEYGIHLAGGDSQVANINVGQSGLAGLYVQGGAYLITNVKSWCSGRLDYQSPGFWFAGNTLTVSSCHSQENRGQGFLWQRSGANPITGFIGAGLLSDSNNDAMNHPSEVAAVNGYTTFVDFDVRNVTGAVITGVTTKAAGIGGTTTAGLQVSESSVYNSITLGVQGQSSYVATAGSNTADNTIHLNGREQRVQTVSDPAGTVTLNPWEAATVHVTLPQNRTIASPTYAPRGLRWRFIFTQDVTGGRTVTWGPTFKHNWTPDTAPGRTNVIEFISDGTSWIQTNTSTGL